MKCSLCWSFALLTGGMFTGEKSMMVPRRANPSPTLYKGFTAKIRHWLSILKWTHQWSCRRSRGLVGKGVTTDIRQNGAPLNGVAQEQLRGSRVIRKSGWNRLCKLACVIDSNHSFEPASRFPQLLLSDKPAKSPIGLFRSVSYQWLKSCLNIPPYSCFLLTARGLGMRGQRVPKAGDSRGGAETRRDLDIRLAGRVGLSLEFSW
jgi:hypothetical protein